MTSDNNPTWVLDMLTKLGYKTNPSGGIVKIGEGLSVTEDGTLSTTKHVFSILPLSGTGGRINPDHKVTVDKGDSYHVTILPDDGYKISNVIVDGISRGAISEYTFIDISQDHYIAASFEEAPVYGYAISSSISSPSPMTVKRKSYLSFSVPRARRVTSTFFRGMSIPAYTMVNTSLCFPSGA